MVLCLLAHEERLRLSASREGRTGDRVGSHRHPADGGRIPRAGLFGGELRQRAEALRAEDRALGVDQVFGGLTAGQHDRSDHQRVLTQLGQQALAGSRPSVHSHAGYSS